MKKFYKIGAFLMALVMCLCSGVVVYAASPSEYSYEYTNWYMRSIHRYKEVGDANNYLASTYLIQGDEDYIGYCFDLSTNSLKNTKYKRINLEDVLSVKDAEIVRAIAQNGFHPDKPESLGALREATGKDITISEAISGTALALWKYGNTGSSEIEKDYSITENISVFAQGLYQKDVCDTIDEHGDLKDGYSAMSEENIKAVKDYLLEFAKGHPVQAQSQLLTGNFIESYDTQVNGNEIIVTFKLTNNNANGDLTLSVIRSGRKLYSSNLADIPHINDAYQITLKTDNPESLKFTIKGTQKTEKDFYIYQSETPSKSGSLIAKGSGETIINSSVVLNEKCEHVWDEGIVVKEPDCSEKGEKVYTCKKNSSHQYTEEIDALGHTAVTDEAVKPTCDKTGLSEGSHCEVCGAIITPQTEISSLGHNCKEKIKEPACTKDGEKTVYCTNCDYSVTEIIPATGHKVVVDEAIKATSSTEGLTEGKHCEICGEVFVEQKVIPKLEINEVPVTPEISEQEWVPMDEVIVTKDDSVAILPPSSEAKTSPQTGIDADITWKMGVAGGICFGGGLIVLVIMAARSNKNKNN